MQSLTILGSTGSIGQATLSVVQQHLDKFFVWALIAKDNVSLMIQQCLMFNPRYVCMTNKSAAEKLKQHLITEKHNIQILSGMKCACELAAINDVDMVISAISGIAGLQPTFAALRTGKKILLANKETLVVCGKLFMKEAHKYHACILPIDSEHNAIFQNLPTAYQKNLGRASFSEYGISHITLTASGGAFLKISPEKLSKVTPHEACLHPNWSMGPKISIDSATMMNKGLEYIEALHLFNAIPDEIEILLHPQSIIHAMVHYNDGSVLAHLAPPDMKIPIAYAMAYPDRINLLGVIPKLNIKYLNKLYFEKIEIQHYPCLQLAIDANNDGHMATIVLNAANEVAVEAFLQKMISFVEIPDLIRRVLDSINLDCPINNIDDILYIDCKAREKAMQYIAT